MKYPKPERSPKRDETSYGIRFTAECGGVSVTVAVGPCRPLDRCACWMHGRCAGSLLGDYICRCRDSYVEIQLEVIFRMACLSLHALQLLKA